VAVAAATLYAAAGSNHLIALPWDAPVRKPWMILAENLLEAAADAVMGANPMTNFQG
jgi:hypothetical protein